MLKNWSLIVFLGLVFLSCKKEGFDDKNADFQRAYDQLITNGNDEMYTMDLPIHSYTFTLSEDRALFAIGYRSHKDLESTDYLIEIIDNSDSTVVYNGLHQFKQNKVSYVTPNSPVLIESGVSYTVNRIQTNWGDDIGATIGSIVLTNESDYPVSFGIMTITQSEFYDIESTSPRLLNYGVPQIELVFD